MSRCRDELREKVARKTRKIVSKQTPLALEEFLAQGQRRSRQRRKPSEEMAPQLSSDLVKAAGLA